MVDVAEKTCESCTYFRLKRTGRWTRFMPNGECRRWPPVNNGIATGFPGVRQDDFCGEYLKRADEP